LFLLAPDFQSRFGAMLRTPLDAWSGTFRTVETTYDPALGRQKKPARLCG
jgi:hypothetical protein